MRDDPVKKLIEGDELIIRLGASLICRKGKAQKKNILHDNMPATEKTTFQEILLPYHKKKKRKASTLSYL